jgi:hypothetical protein
MTADRVRRRLRVLRGRGLHLLRSHYFSFISGGVIGGIFVFAMTSSSFSGSDHEGIPPSAASAARSGSVANFRTRPASIVYYIVDSIAQRDAIVNAIQSDQTYRAPTIARNGPDEFDFFIASNADEDAIVAGLVSNALDVARQNGIGLRIIDVRTPKADATGTP